MDNLKMKMIQLGSNQLVQIILRSSIFAVAAYGYKIYVAEPDFHEDHFPMITSEGRAVYPRFVLVEEPEQEVHN